MRSARGACPCPLHRLGANPRMLSFSLDPSSFPPPGDLRLRGLIGRRPTYGPAGRHVAGTESQLHCSEGKGRPAALLSQLRNHRAGIPNALRDARNHRLPPAPAKTANSMSPCASARPSSTTTTPCAATAAGSPPAHAHDFEDYRQLHQAPHLAGDRPRLPRRRRAADPHQDQHAGEGGRRGQLRRFLDASRQPSPCRPRRSSKFDDAGVERARPQALRALRQLSERAHFARLGQSAQTDTRYFVNYRGLAHRSTAADSRAWSSAPPPRPPTAPTSARSRLSRPLTPPGCRTIRSCNAAIDRVANDVTESAQGARGRAVRRPGHLLRPRRRRLLPRDFRPPRGGPPPEGREPKARPSPRASAPRCCPISSRWCSTPRSARSTDIDLNGWYDYDDEGVKGRPVLAVDKGVLKTFLMSRSPIKGFDHSNGHGRRQPGLRSGFAPIEPDRGIHATPCPTPSCAQMLIDEVKRQNKPYGLYFRDITGGFTTTAARRIAGVQSDPGDRLPRLSRRPARTNWCAAPISSARRWRASPRSSPPATSRKCSTATAAPNRAACRFRRCRRRFWFPKSRSKRRPSPTTARRCFLEPTTHGKQGGGQVKRILAAGLAAAAARRVHCAQRASRLAGRPACFRPCTTKSSAPAQLSHPRPGDAVLRPIRARRRRELQRLGQSGRVDHAPPRPFPLARSARARGRLQVRQHQLRRRAAAPEAPATTWSAFRWKTSIPLLRRYFWLETDSAYKSAVEAISRKRAALRNITQTDSSTISPHAEPVHYLHAIPKLYHRRRRLGQPRARPLRHFRKLSRP